MHRASIAGKTRVTRRDDSHTDACRSRVSPAALAGYRTLLPPTIPAGIVPGKIPVSNPLVTEHFCVSLCKAGWDAVAPWPGVNPADWFKKTLRHYLAPRLHESTESNMDARAQGTDGDAMQLAIDINTSDDGDCVYLGMREANEGAPFLSAGPLALKAEEYRPGLGAHFLSALGTDFWIVTPMRVQEMVGYMYWQGGDSEEEVSDQYDTDDPYQGPTRDQLLAAFPAWACMHAEAAAACRQISADDLGVIARTGPEPFRNIARECLFVRSRKWDRRRADKANLTPNFDELGFEDVWGWGGVTTWSREDEFTTRVVDEAYNYAMQINSSPYNVLVNLPQDITPAGAKQLIHTLVHHVERFSAVSRLLALCR